MSKRDEFVKTILLAKGDTIDSDKHWASINYQGSQHLRYDCVEGAKWSFTGSEDAEARSSLTWENDYEDGDSHAVRGVQMDGFSCPCEEFKDVTLRYEGDLFEALGLL